MATYLIDYENTGVKGLVGIEQLKEDDLIIIFYGPKTGAVPFDEHVKICQAASQVKYIKTTKTAKNYLDFQLTTYLGYLVRQLLRQRSRLPERLAERTGLHRSLSRQCREIIRQSGERIRRYMEKIMRH